MATNVQSEVNVTVWQIDIYDNANDNHPSRRAIVDAPTESRAADIAADIMGDSQRAEVKRVVLKGNPDFRDREVIWI